MATRTTEVQPAPPLRESVVEVAPLAVEEAFPDMLEAQSPTLMIQSVLGELASEGETVEAQGVVKEEEGSSSTLGKEDIEDEKATCEVQIAQIPTK